MNTANKKNILLENVVFLFMLQGVNYLLPLITFPYLVRTLGLERFGLLSFALSFVQYFILITDYGFNLTATRQISINKTDIIKVSQIFCSVMIVKIILLITCFMGFAAIVWSVEKFRQNHMLYFIMFLAVAGNVVYPVWLFQGMEKMKLLSVISCIGRVIVTVLIFIFIHQPGDFLLAAFIQVLGVLLSGAIAMTLVKYNFRIRYALPPVAEIKEAVVNGWYVFVSQISVTLFTNTNIFLLGIFANNTIVGYFSIADRIVRAVVSLTTPLTTAIYPHVSELFNSSKENALAFLRKVLLRGSFVFGALSLLLFLFSDTLIVLVSGHHNASIGVMIRIMSILPFSVFLDNLWGTQIMLNIGMNKQFMYILLGAGLFSIANAIVFVPHYAALASAVIFVVTELLILTMMITLVRAKKIYVIIGGII